jgi:cysteinyl-tRNA synthetase
LLGTHYRDPLDWTADRLRQASQDLFRFYVALNRGKHPVTFDRSVVPREVQEALSDDLNAPLALARLHEITREINLSHDLGNLDERDRLQAALCSSGQLMGLLGTEPETFLKGAQREDDALIRSRISAREQARKERRFADADLIRSELANIGIALEDKPDGTTEWRRA